VLESDVLTITTQALVVATKVIAPLLIVSLIVGLLVSLLQAVFQVQDQVLAMVPRLAACGLVLVLTGGWMLHVLVDYTVDLFGSIPDLVR
jgi:flagellar biosynthetic protein FliQ